MVLSPVQNKTAQRLAFVCLLSGFILFAAGSLTEYRWIGQGIGVVSLVAGIQYLVRFVFARYRYILEYTDDGGCDLIVCRTTGGKDIKLCHISMGGVSQVVPREKKNVKAQKVYNYCQNFGTKGVSVIYEDGGRLTEIILEADAAFTDALISSMNTPDGDMKFAM